MYSCEKLAKGKRIGYESARNNDKQVIIPTNKHEYNFADIRKYNIQIALYEDRPRSLIYRQRKK